MVPIPRHSSSMSDALAESFRDCQKLARRAGKNFYWSFLTLPREMRRDMCALYAFMRQTDDLGDDESYSLEERRQRLATWTALVRGTLAENGGSSLAHTAQQATKPLRIPAVGLPAIADVVQRRQIPVSLLEDVIRGVESDLQPRDFHSFPELEEYCYHVAGAVGLCCIHIWGFSGPEARQPAIDCGTAFQLTNILRDLQEDSLRGRVYLPRNELALSGVSVEDFKQGRSSRELQALMRFQAERARDFYDRGTRLLPFLSPAGQKIHSAMLRIYGGLLTEIERRQYDVFSRRVELTLPRKLLIAAQCWWRPGLG